ncbi:MAG: acyl-CoA dehydrogenase family protein [Pseudomonadota bacterium]
MDTETFEQLLATIERYVGDRLIPAEREVSDTDAIPADIVAEMRDMGLFGLTIPEEFGGIGLNVEEEMRVVMALCRASPAFRSLIGTNNGIGSLGIVLAGTNAQKVYWLPRLASGETIASFALTEPEAGSDAAAVRTKAEKVDGGWVLNGGKRYITNAGIAGVFTVFARTEQDGGSGVTAFLVPAGVEGLRVSGSEAKMGQQGAHIHEVYFDDCRIPDDALLGEPGKGFAVAMRILARGRLHIAAVCCGLAERALEEALGYAMERKQFGEVIANFQLVQALLADSRAESLAGRELVLATARRRDAGQDVDMEASCAKMFCSEMVGRVTDRAVQVLGGAGYLKAFPVERLYRDARILRIYEGTTQIQQLVIAKAMLRRARAGSK